MTHILRSLALAALLSSTFAVQAANSTEQAAALKNIFKDMKALNTGAPLGEATAQLNEKQTFTQEELLTICEVATKKLRGYDDVVESQSYEQLQATMKAMVTQLKDYKISGVGFAMHPSWSVFYGKQNFNADLVYKNSKGEAAAQTANIAYSSFGWQAELVWRFDAIFAVGTDLSRYSTRTPLELGTGFTAGYRLPFLCPQWETHPKSSTENIVRDLGLRVDPAVIASLPETLQMYRSLGVVGVTVLPLKGAQGSLVIAHFGVGLTGMLSHSTTAPTAFNLALVMGGGTFTPQATVTK